MKYCDTCKRETAGGLYCDVCGEARTELFYGFRVLADAIKQLSDSYEKINDPLVLLQRARADSTIHCDAVVVPLVVLDRAILLLKKGQK